MTRDSLVWTVTFVSAILSFVASSSGLLQAAFPALGSTGDARIAFAAAIAGFVSGYMKMSPLPLSPDHPFATSEASTVLSPVNSSKAIGTVLLACALAGGVAASGCASHYTAPAGTYSAQGAKSYTADQLLKDIEAISETAIRLNAATGKEHMTDRDTALVRDFALSAGAALQAYGTGGTTLQAARDAYGQLMLHISVDAKQQPALAALLMAIGGALNQVQ